MLKVKHVILKKGKLLSSVLDTVKKAHEILFNKATCYDGMDLEGSGIKPPLCQLPKLWDTGHITESIYVSVFSPVKMRKM